MIRNICFLSLFLFSLSSCYTIHFSKGSNFPYYQTSQWHHIGLLGLMEFSDPVNLEQICPANSWDSVRVQTGFLQGLVRYISIPTGGSYTMERPWGSTEEWPITISIGTFYSPEEVSVSCKK